MYQVYNKGDRFPGHPLSLLLVLSDELLHQLCDGRCLADSRSFTGVCESVSLGVPGIVERLPFNVPCGHCEWTYPIIFPCVNNGVAKSSLFAALFAIPGQNIPEICLSAGFPGYSGLWRRLSSLIVFIIHILLSKFPNPKPVYEVIHM